MVPQFIDASQNVSRRVLEIEREVWNVLHCFRIFLWLLQGVWVYASFFSVSALAEQVKCSAFNACVPFPVYLSLSPELSGIKCRVCTGGWEGAKLYLDLEARRYLLVKMSVISRESSVS